MTRTSQIQVIISALYIFQTCVGWKHIIRHISRVTPTKLSADDDNDVGSTWMRDSNKIEYVMGPLTQQFDSLEEIGLSIASDMTQRNISIIPFHLTSSSDLFCNRELNMNHIEAIGFDMDWTLAQYNEEFDLLAYNGAVNLLVETLGYPQELYSYRYKQNMYRRGCLIDKKRGNIIKLDRHRYVRMAEHGLTPLSRTDRKAIYKYSFEGLHEMTGNGYENIDTPFSLIDACLFAQLVDLKDRLGGSNEVLNTRTYNQLWNDARKCVDLCHRNGVIKLTVANNPEKYIIYDPNLFPMLDQFRKAGKKTFILTNSLWDYTQVVMSYLEGRKSGPNKDLKWMDYFDVVVVGGNKPAFLTDDRDSLPIYHVRPADGALKNIEFIPTDPMPMLNEGKVFQGGNAMKLHQLLQIKSGEKVLYVGDHIFSDILRTKRSVGWRTCLIVPELSQEIIKDRQNRDEWKLLTAMRGQQTLLEETVDEMTYLLYKLKMRAMTSSAAVSGGSVTSTTYVTNNTTTTLFDGTSSSSSSRNSASTTTATNKKSTKQSLKTSMDEDRKEHYVMDEHDSHTMKRLLEKTAQCYQTITNILGINIHGPSGDIPSPGGSFGGTVSNLPPSTSTTSYTTTYNTKNMNTNTNNIASSTYGLSISSSTTSGSSNSNNDPNLYSVPAYYSVSDTTSTKQILHNIDTFLSTFHIHSDPEYNILFLENQILLLKESVKSLAAKIRSRMEIVGNFYHPRFGPLFRAGFQESRFAVQITDYACVYTSRASNLGFVSPQRALRPPRDSMPHDRYIENESIKRASYGIWNNIQNGDNNNSGNTGNGENNVLIYDGEII